MTSPPADDGNNKQTVLVIRRRRAKRIGFKPDKRAGGRPAVENTRTQINPCRNNKGRTFTPEQRAASLATRRLMGHLLFLIRRTNAVTNEELRQAFETGYHLGVKLTAKAKQGFYDEWVKRQITGEDVKPERVEAPDSGLYELSQAPKRGEIPWDANGEWTGTTADLMRYVGSAQDVEREKEQAKAKALELLNKHGIGLYDPLADEYVDKALLAEIREDDEFNERMYAQRMGCLNTVGVVREDEEE